MPCPCYTIIPLGEPSCAAPVFAASLSASRCSLQRPLSLQKRFGRKPPPHPNDRDRRQRQRDRTAKAVDCSGWRMEHPVRLETTPVSYPLRSWVWQGGSFFFPWLSLCTFYLSSVPAAPPNQFLLPLKTNYLGPTTDSQR